MGMGNELLIQPFNDSGFSRLIELNETTYPGRDISNQEYLGWEYIRNPDGLALITIGAMERKIISQYVVLPRTFSIDNKLLCGSLSVNTLTHPDYRGMGIFEKLANETFNRCKEKNILFTIGFPNPISHPVIEKKQIFETIGFLPLLFRPLNPFVSLIRYIKNRKNKSGDEIEIYNSDEILSANTGISFFDFKNDSEKYEIFLQKFNNEKQNVTNRSLHFIKWRYVTIPNRKYYILKIEIENKIIALVIFRAKYIFGLRCCIIVDIMTPFNSADVKILLETIHKIAVKNKFDILFTTAPAHSWEYAIIKDFGFYSMSKYLLPQRLAFIVKRHLSTSPQQVSDFRKWFLTFGDYDIF